MDKINLNLYGLNFQKQVEKKEEEKKTSAEEKAPVNSEEKQVDNEAIYNAMQLSAAQNKAVVMGNALAIDHSKYQNDESIARIQASMGKFEGTVEDMVKVIAAEFPGLSEAQVNALAASAVLQTL